MQSYQSDLEKRDVWLTVPLGGVQFPSDLADKC